MIKFVPMTFLSRSTSGSSDMVMMSNRLVHELDSPIRIGIGPKCFMDPISSNVVKHELELFNRMFERPNEDRSLHSENQLKILIVCSTGFCKSLSGEPGRYNFQISFDKIHYPHIDEAKFLDLSERSSRQRSRRYP
jgi:hypothetical protein